MEEVIEAYESVLAKLNEIQKIKSIMILFVNEDFTDFDYLKYLSILEKKNTLDIIILTNKTVLKALRLGMNIIYLSNKLFTGKGIGILPTSESKLSTSGLKWDMKDQVTQFSGELISTSNQIGGDDLDNMNSFKVYIEYGCCVVTFELK